MFSGSTWWLFDCPTRIGIGFIEIRTCVRAPLGGQAQQDPGIFQDPRIELKSWNFSGFIIKQNNDFKDFYWFFNKNPRILQESRILQNPVSSWPGLKFLRTLGPAGSQIGTNVSCTPNQKNMELLLVMAPGGQFYN